MDNRKKLILFWMNQINEYIQKFQFDINPLPEIELADSKVQKNDQNDILISTGGYMPELKKIVLYIDNRHIKDILRSYCHELVHHNQNLDNPDYIRRTFKQYPSDLDENAELEELESDAYNRGNIAFRKFTEWFKRQQNKKDKGN